jgi:site-specific DNA recombinase
VNHSARSAIYARYSSEKQNSLTIDQQIRKCREHADRSGLRIEEEHVYADQAISGATDDRGGLQRLLSAAKSVPRPFDVILVDDTSRLSRKLVDSLRIFELLQFAGVRVVFVAQGIDTNSEQAELLVATHGIVDSLYLKDLSKRTFRGVEQLAINGLHTGGRVFGYRRVPIESAAETDCHGRPLIKGVRLAVDPDQASTVRRIFERYAAGDSLKRVALDLNDEGIPSPQPQKGRVSQSWCPSSIRHILHNERYRGIVIWGKTFKLRSQETGKRIYRRKAESEWRRTDLPEQRIVTDTLWNAVRERMLVVQHLYGVEAMAGILRGRAAASPYLFTGLLECSVCHGSVTIVSGQWKNRGDSRYGCSMHAYRGVSVCTNNLLVGRSRLEAQLLAGLQAKVLHPDVIEYTLQSFETQLLRSASHRGDQSAVFQKRVEGIEKQIRNCTDAIAEGRRYPSLMAKLSELEQDLADTKAKIASSAPRTVQLQLRDTRRFVESRLRNLASLLNGEPRLVRAEIAKHVSKITLTPEGRTYVASGSWNLLGNVAVTMVPGARIELATPAFSGRRSTSELPRHG